ncbi:MAG TPA: DUF4231 domain-containing protein [Amycolatopsis sp.]|uniref:DUF4231 domain-containing protein n=1 Tax=Amycolatopsis sp. TaxID=37632 RepID=UPI002B484ABB|nr:DUF4231 domain-containing protein [Amycolatopsis sp.]HKS50088.1 DUF4231 domain-containing protein [Amycolatopsis sp.]
MTSDSSSTAALTMLWQRQSVWSQAAGRIKAEIGRARVAVLVLTITGAVLGTASAQVIPHHTPVGRLLAVASAVALAVAAFLGRTTSIRLVRDWTRTRSASEAIKSDVYTYLAGVAPFRDAHRNRILLERLEKLGDSVADLAKYTAGLTPVARPLPEVSDVDSYTGVRVHGQIDGYYRPKAAQLTRRLAAFRRGEAALAVTAAILAAVVGVLPEAALTAWIGVLTTAATALTAHAAASRYEYQQIEFTRTADELERLLAARAVAPGDARADDDFVARCEQVISIQNEGWMAKLSTADDGS